MDASLLFAFWLLSISLVMTPGADWACAITAGMGQRALLPALSGMLLGYVWVTLLVAAGAGALVVHFPLLLRALTVLGAGYLLWLGMQALRHPPVPAAAGTGTGPEIEIAPGATAGRAFGWVKRGFVVSGTNPKVLLLFLALLPQFTTPKATLPVPMQVAALGGIQIVNCALVLWLVGQGARVILRRKPEAARWLGLFSGGAMIVIALALLAEPFVIG
ncbi:LysE family translocator [Paracoccus aminophilus]|uniref:LysE family translocator n=1 Tax=Paracoccus aminophilus TaxID=34003 RepID=UPI0004259B75|nr:LysE family translocator [Paracoccus aminophilus]